MPISYRQRMKWFHEARFGMFIHWGLYSLLERGEWVMYHERIKRAEYARLADKFNPKKFDPDAWASLARDAGMKYMVLTTRHHDGFCLYDSKASDFTSVKTRAGRDFVAEYVKACRKAGLRVGFYYSLLDWRFPGYFAGPKKDPKSFNAMVEQVHAQVREILTNYGRIDYLFFDGGWLPSVFDQSEPAPADQQHAKFWKAQELCRMIRRLQPAVIINNRTGLAGDLDTPEQHVTASKKGRGWESCMTIGDFSGWGYIRNNPNMKPASQLIQYLVTAAAGEGNYLLNVGPKPDGRVRIEEVTRLREIGKFMKIAGESIYNSERSAAGWNQLGPMTAKGSALYLHMFRYPGKVAVIAGLANRVKSARLLGSKRKLKVEREHDGRVLIKGLPEKPVYEYDTVVALELEDKPRAIKNMFGHRPIR